jgi:hypothetical protein
MERLRLEREDAFETLRGNARSRRRSVTDVAEQLVGSAETLNQVAGQVVSKRELVTQSLALAIVPTL